MSEQLIDKCSDCGNECLEPQGAGSTNGENYILCQECSIARVAKYAESHGYSYKEFTEMAHDALDDEILNQDEFDF